MGKSQLVRTSATAVRAPGAGSVRAGGGGAPLGARSSTSSGSNARFFIGEGFVSQVAVGSTVAQKLKPADNMNALVANSQLAPTRTSISGRIAVAVTVCM